MLRFLRNNSRWLGAGFLLTFASSFGQTWFISLFADFLKATHGLSDGGWGSLYTVATLGSAGVMFWRGSMADTVPLSRLAPLVALVFALACAGMALAQSLWHLVILLFLLRFCGQGMFPHLAMTGMGRWFEARRGRAVSIANLGHPTGEITLSLLVVAVIGVIGWRSTWGVVAVVLALGVAPLLAYLLAESRDPKGQAPAPVARPGLDGRHWRRGDALRHWALPAMIPLLLTPGFIGTVVFFHQAHIAGVKGWTLAAMAPGYSFFGLATVSAAFAAGWAADRFGAQRLLPVTLLPMGLGTLLILPATEVSTWWIALMCLGLTQGMAGSLWGVIFPVLYGTQHLGSIRSLATTLMVVSTAIGPGLTGVLIDRGVAFPQQCLALALWCLGVSVLCLWVARRVSRALVI